jgi:hypothetical protein
MKTDWIQTFTGKKFYPLEPVLEEICIEDIAHSLSMQCRFGGHCKEFYSVAQHCHAMVTGWFPGSRNKELAKYALLHDASEAYLSDIPRPLKYLPEFQFYRDAEKHLSEMIYIRFGLNPVEPAEIKRIDWELLCEEAMSPRLMSPLHPEWVGRCEPVMSFSKCSPERAEEIYLAKFHQLFSD